MFLNNLSIYSIPFIGIIFLIISLTFSKTIHLFSYQLSRIEKKHQTVNNHTSDSQNSHVSIQVNLLSQIDDNRQRTTTTTTLSLDDDDDELIKSDISSNFCENDSIELRLDQDLEYDNDQTNETDT
jgi:hypothetical protein